MVCLDRCQRHSVVPVYLGGGAGRGGNGNGDGWGGCTGRPGKGEMPGGLTRGAKHGLACCIGGGIGVGRARLWRGGMRLVGFVLLEDLYNMET